jgi:effector-binding domain-containing protein
MITMENVRNHHLHHYHSVFAMHPDGDELLPEGNYLAIAYRGDYTDGNARCIPLLLSYLEEARLKADGDLLELVWVDIHTTGNRAEYLTQLQLKVKNI